MIELILNAVWMVLAAGAFIAAPRKSARTLLALLFALVLLFPIISVSDDLGGAGNSLEELLALVVASFALFIGLSVVARLSARDERRSLVYVTAPSDPRSPPRR
jgi:hypothetical protein